MTYSACLISRKAGWVRLGRLPEQIPASERWDPKAIDGALDLLRRVDPRLATANDESRWNRF
jgi:hypothetical protein